MCQYLRHQSRQCSLGIARRHCQVSQERKLMKLSHLSETSVSQSLPCQSEDCKTNTRLWRCRKESFYPWSRHRTRQTFKSCHRGRPMWRHSIPATLLISSRIGYLSKLDYSLREKTTWAWSAHQRGSLAKSYKKSWQTRKATVRLSWSRFQGLCKTSQRLIWRSHPELTWKRSFLDWSISRCKVGL